MQHAYGLEIPQTLQEVCSPQRMALLVYDMQVGIVRHVPDADGFVARVARVVDAARRAGMRVMFARHLSLPNELAGVFQLRQAKAWQGKARAADTRPLIPHGSPGFALVPELEPRAGEAVLDKITMSAFEGTPLDIVLRDCGIDTYVVVGVAMEIGIEPTVRHSLDLGYLPIVVTDACGYGNAAAASRSLETLRFAGGTLFATTAELLAALDGAPA